MGKTKELLGNIFQEFMPDYLKRKEAEEMEYYFTSCLVRPQDSQFNDYISQFKRLNLDGQRQALIKAKEWNMADLVNKMQQIHTEI